MQNLALSDVHSIVYPGRCQTCYMRSEVCICDLLSTLENRTPVTVIMHHRERHKTTNTARIACLMLQNSQILVRGLQDAPLDFSLIHRPEYQSVLLTLNPRSQELTKEWVKAQDRPLHLIVPDGSWRQASKIGKREPGLKDIPWVKLPAGPLSSYHLRFEHNPAGLSTLEAMARALGIIENEKLQANLEEVFQVMVARTLKTRGQSPVEFGAEYSDPSTYGVE